MHVFHPVVCMCADAVHLCDCLRTCMCPAMPLKLVAPGEAFPAEDPVADERPLSRMPAQVSPQVRRFSVNLPATLHMTHVLFLL